MRVGSFLVSYDAILYVYVGTSQLLAQYKAVATLIEEGKKEMATKTNLDQGGAGFA